MQRLALCLAVSIPALGTIGGAWPPHPTQSAADQVLADMRQALGGDRALSAVESFQMRGVRMRRANIGPPLELDIEIATQLPDRYVRISENRNATSLPAAV